MTRPSTLSETMPRKSWLKRMEIAMRGGASRKVRHRAETVTLEEGEWGSWAPTPAQRRFIRLMRSSPMFRSALRNHVALWLDNMRAGPIDEYLYGSPIRFYPMLGASFRHMLLTPDVYEVQERAFLAKFAGGAGAFIDIGANAGIYTLWSCMQWPGRPVIAFEPLDLFAKILERNTEMAGFQSVDVVRAVAGARDGVMEFSASTQSAAYGTDTAATRCRSLLSVLEEIDVSAVAGLKIDAEGVEDQILGAFLVDTPAHLLPRAVLIEHVVRHLWEQDCLDLLEQRGYRIRFRNYLNTGLVLDAENNRKLS